MGGSGQDAMTGGAGHETFLYNSDPFDGKAPALAAPTAKIPGVNAPDTITDFDVTGTRSSSAFPPSASSRSASRTAPQRRAGLRAGAGKADAGDG